MAQGQQKLLSGITLDHVRHQRTEKFSPFEINIPARESDLINFHVVEDQVSLLSLEHLAHFDIQLFAMGVTGHPLSPSCFLTELMLLLHH